MHQNGFDSDTKQQPKPPILAVVENHYTSLSLTCLLWFVQRNSLLGIFSDYSDEKSYKKNKQTTIILILFAFVLLWLAVYL